MSDRSPSRSSAEIANDLYFIASEDHLRAEKSLILEAACALSTPSETASQNAVPQVPAMATSGVGVAEVDSPASNGLESATSVQAPIAEPCGAAPSSSDKQRQFHIGAQNDATYIISGEAPALNNDYPRHDADRTCVAKVYDEAEAKRLVDAANAALCGARSAEQRSAPAGERWWYDAANGRFFSDDFTYDAALKLTGDFPDEHAKTQYAAGLLKRLVAPSHALRSDAEMLEGYASSYARMGGRVLASDVAYDIRHNMIPALSCANSATASSPPAGYTLIDTELFNEICRALTPEQQRGICIAEGSRWFKKAGAT